MLPRFAVGRGRFLGYWRRLMEKREMIRALPKGGGSLGVRGCFRALLSAAAAFWVTGGEVTAAQGPRGTRRSMTAAFDGKARM